MLVAAGHTAGDGRRALAGADVILLDEPQGVGSDGLALQKTSAVDKLRLKVALEHHVVLQGEVQHQAVLVAIFGDVADAGGGTLADGGVGDVLPLEHDFAPLGLLQTGETVDQLSLSVAVNAGDADDLPCSDGKTHVPNGIVVVELGGDGQMFHLQNGLVRLGRFLVNDKIHVTADHHTG